MLVIGTKDKIELLTASVLTNDNSHYVIDVIKPHAGMGLNGIHRTLSSKRSADISVRLLAYSNNISPIAAHVRRSLSHCRRNEDGAYNTNEFEIQRVIEMAERNVRSKEFEVKSISGGFFGKGDISGSSKTKPALKSAKKENPTYTISSVIAILALTAILSAGMSNISKSNIPLSSGYSYIIGIADKILHPDSKFLRRSLSLNSAIVSSVGQNVTTNRNRPISFDETLATYSGAILSVIHPSTWEGSVNASYKSEDGMSFVFSNPLDATHNVFIFRKAETSTIVADLQGKPGVNDDDLLKIAKTMCSSRKHIYPISTNFSPLIILSDNSNASENDFEITPGTCVEMAEKEKNYADNLSHSAVEKDITSLFSMAFDINDFQSSPVSREAFPIGDNVTEFRIRNDGDFPQNSIELETGLHQTEIMIFYKDESDYMERKSSANDIFERGICTIFEKYSNPIEIFESTQELGFNYTISCGEDSTPVDSE
jgi:hypothetical protein